MIQKWRWLKTLYIYATFRMLCVNLKGCLELSLKTVGFSVIDLAKDCVQIKQLTH